MRIAGIDQGTTSTRALIVSSDGKLEVVRSIIHRQSFPRAGWVEQDPEEILRNIRTCLEAAGKLDAVGLDNQGESCLAWDAETKEALYPIIGWQDRRTLPDLNVLRAQGGETETLCRAGLPLDPYFSASKLTWIVKNVPEAQSALKKGTLRLGTTDAFFLDRLTGRFLTDVTTASRTSLMKLDELNWDKRLCELFGVPIECLPEIVPTTGEFGSVDTEFGPVPITASIVDQQAALYGFGCRHPGETKITFGTGAFALMTTGEKIINKPELGLLPTVAWQLDGQDAVYALDGGVFTASSAINWAQSLGLFSDLSEINAYATPPAIESGLAFVPALSGLGCPHWEPGARGVWLGLSLGHTREQLVQSILEGVAFRATEVIDAMNQCVAIKGAIHIDGGMSTNPYFVQFLADASGREICPAAVPELTGLGTLKLAYHATGHQPEIDPAFGSYNPKTDHRQAYGLFEKAVAMSREWSKN
jgi:glycerol kinase